MPDFTRLDRFLDEGAYDGYLMEAASAEANQRYLTGFTAPDPFVSLYTPDDLRLLVRGLEITRAKAESRATHVSKPADHVDGTTSNDDHDAIAGFLHDAGVRALAVPARFPVGTADALRERSFAVTVADEDPIAALRAVKTPEELEHIRATQRAAEQALEAAETLLREATAEDGILVHAGEPLRAEDLKREIEVSLVRSGCALDDTIVAPGTQGAAPHERGSGPIPTGRPIVVDVFPRSKTTGYHADLTRTFVVGEPDDGLRERHALTVEAVEAAIDAIAPGVSGEEVHAAACAVYEAAGYPTLQSDPDTGVGFIHGTGHGVGLDVHEPPRLAAGGGPLEAGNVVTIEPGLYDPAWGGLRVEELAVVTANGCEVITDYPRRLVLP